MLCRATERAAPALDRASLISRTAKFEGKQRSVRELTGALGARSRTEIGYSNGVFQGHPEQLLLTSKSPRYRSNVARGVGMASSRSRVPRTHLFFFGSPSSIEPDSDFWRPTRSTVTV